MKRFTGILLILCLVLPFAGSYCLMQYKKHKVKKEIKWRMIAGLDLKELVLLKFNNKDTGEQLRWEHSREFEFSGQMYDVVTKEIHNDTTYYWCWWDHEETKLNKQLSNLVTLAMGRNPENQQQQQRLADFMKFLFVEDSDKYSFKITEGTEANYQYLFLRYNSPEFIPLSPPPELL